MLGLGSDGSTLRCTIFYAIIHLSNAVPFLLSPVKGQCENFFVVFPRKVKISTSGCKALYHLALFVRRRTRMVSRYRVRFILRLRVILP